MQQSSVFTPEQLRYLRLLSRQFPTIQQTATEILRLRAILNLPKGTEHFMSDIHGEHEAFLHILNSCSGEVKVKITELFTGLLSKEEMDDLATLIYYPRTKLSRIADTGGDLDGIYGNLIHRLVELGRFVSVKHTRLILGEAHIYLNKIQPARPCGYGAFQYILALAKSRHTKFHKELHLYVLRTLYHSKNG